MTRAPTADDGREESYDELGAASGAADGLILHHRYAAEAEYADGRKLDRMAQRRADQAEADAGRTVYGIPWLGRAQERLKVRHRQWAKHPDGSFTCRKPSCGFSARWDEARIAHQEGHRERDRVFGLLADDHDKHVAANRDLAEQVDALADEVTGLRVMFDVLMLALGSPSDEVLQGAVDRVIGYANARHGGKGEVK